jgi:putative endonuclease
MAYCYILYSEKVDKYYIGKTSDLPEQRLLKHLQNFYQKKKYTNIADDWKIFWSQGCKNIAIAGKIEKHLKQMKSRKYLDNLKKYPELAKKLIEKYS